MTDHWLGVGQYPTPVAMADEFVADLISFIRQSPAAPLLRKKRLFVADMFAGDGRLGIACRTALKEETNGSVHTTFVECDPVQATRINGKGYPGNLVIANAFLVKPTRSVDVVIANPPYLALNVGLAKSLGFKWNDVADSGRNLYGLSLRRAIEMCAPGCITGVIAPFGWLRGHYSRFLRRFIGRHCSHVAIKAHRDRKLFEGAQQDIAFQFFVKRKPGDRSTCDVTFVYERGVPVVTHLPYRRRKRSEKTAHFHVRVGPFVWNRNKRHIRLRKKKGTIPIIYGGNIGHDGAIRTKVRKYEKRQFVKRQDIPEEWISKGPALLIRRTLRGQPGAWRIDSAIVKSSRRFVLENHVIMIKAEGGSASLKKLAQRVVRALQNHVKFVGAPNLTAHKVRDILRRV